MSQQVSQKEADRINQLLDKGVNPRSIAKKLMAHMTYQEALTAVDEVIDCHSWRLYAAL